MSSGGDNASRGMTSDLQKLQEVRDALLRLHKALLDSERAFYEREIARIGSPNEFLNLLLNDPHFDWLRRLSELVVDIDERTESKDDPIMDIDASAFIATARNLLDLSNSDGEFQRKYGAALQRDPNIVIMHGQIRKLLTPITGP